MNINYILTASGNVTLPQVNAAIYAETNEKATEAAKQLAGVLSKADYFQFTLFNVNNDNGHKQIATFRVEQSDPIVFVR